MIWIIDASVALKWFIEDELNPNADAVFEKVVETPDIFAVPELFAFEVYAVLQRVHPWGLEVFRKAVLPMLQGGILRHPMTEKLAKAADYFTNLGLTGYDACYAGLAKDLNGRWLTFDRKAHRLIEKEKISWLLEIKMPKDW